MKKRLISMLLLVVMVLGMLPATALAANPDSSIAGIPEGLEIEGTKVTGYTGDATELTIPEGDDTNPAANAFAEGFKAWLKEDSARLTDNSNSEEISAVTACGYDAYMAIYYALDKAQSTDGATLRDALAALDVPGLVTGDLKFDENGDAIKSYAIIKTATTEGFVFADSVAIE